MSSWDRFTETFFNGKVMLRYLPDILWGVVVTIELALLVVVTGIAAGLAAALLRSLGIRPLNWLIIGPTSFLTPESPPNALEPPTIGGAAFTLGGAQTSALAW